MATQPSLKSVGSLFAESWQLYRKHANVLALIGVIPLIFAGARLVIEPGFVISYGYSVWLILVLLAAAGVFALLELVFYLAMPLALAEVIDLGHKGKDSTPAPAYSRAFAGIIQYLFVLLLTVTVVAGGSILFIIPGIIVGIYLKFTLFTYLFEGKRGMDALVASAWYVKGSWWAILGRQIVLAIVLILTVLVFAIITGIILIVANAGGTFGTPIWSILVQMFVFMFAVPYGLVYVYLVYKDAKSLKDGKEPTRAFTDESEQIFIILILVAAVVALVLFFMSSFINWNIRSGRGFMAQGSVMYSMDAGYPGTQNGLTRHYYRN